jgi:hypothetical protein
MEVETFVGGVGTPKRRFLTAVRTVQKINKTIKAFQNFKNLKEHIIEKTEKQNMKTQSKWQRLIASPPKVLSEEKMNEESAIVFNEEEMPSAASESEIDVPVSVSVPDVEEPLTSASIEGQPPTKRLKSLKRSSSSDYDLGGGTKKHTRKHKNKRNKKTRQRNKKTRKNKTLKIKRGKRKHRTRRN